MPESTDEHKLGALLIALASASTGNYVLIRTGMTRKKPKRLQWRVSVRPSEFQTDVASGMTLIEAIERALLKLGVGP